MENIFNDKSMPFYKFGDMMFLKKYRLESSANVQSVKKDLIDVDKQEITFIVLRPNLQIQFVIPE